MLELNTPARRRRTATRPARGGRVGRWRRWAPFALLLLASAASVAPGASAGPASSPRATVTIDGRRLSESTGARPLPLDPSRPAELRIEVDNPGSSELAIGSVRMEGRAIGLPFFAYDSQVGREVPAQARDSLRLDIDLATLDGQATGLLRGAVQLLDADREVVAAEEGVFDVRGSLRSVYGLFGLGVALLTGQALALCLIDLATHRLPSGRVNRALRFLTPGIGTGLLINFTLSATRVYVPTVGGSVTIVVLSSAVLFGLGYLTPHPARDEPEVYEAISGPPPPASPGEVPEVASKPEAAPQETIPG